MNYFSFSPNFSLQLQQSPQAYPARTSLPTNFVLNSKTATTQHSHSPSPIAFSTTRTPPAPKTTLLTPLLPLPLVQTPQKTPLSPLFPQTPSKLKYN
jgi:hypothetical protein